MKAIIKSLELKQYEVKNGENKGKKFKKFVFVVEVTTDEVKNIIKDMKGSMSEEYGRKYFKEACGLTTTSQAIGKECEVITQKRKWKDRYGDLRIVTEVRYMHILDDDGKPIYLMNDENDDTVF